MGEYIFLKYCYFHELFSNTKESRIHNPNGTDIGTGTGGEVAVPLPVTGTKSMIPTGTGTGTGTVGAVPMPVTGTGIYPWFRTGWHRHRHRFFFYMKKKTLPPIIGTVTLECRLRPTSTGTGDFGTVLVIGTGEIYRCTGAGYRHWRLWDGAGNRHRRPHTGTGTGTGGHNLNRYRHRRFGVWSD